MNQLRNILLTILICTFATISTQAQPWQTGELPKREIRAVWLTTLSGLDWPRIKARDINSIENQKQELRVILDQLATAKINTVVMQTRIRGSVIYPSDIEPWDECMSGKANVSPGYDPLKFAIDECHKRGMELHAWVVSIPLGKIHKQRGYGNKSILRQHPELCKTVGEENFMVPGNPATADYISKLCVEIASRYDIDGISLDYIRYPEKMYHFSDDYLYPTSSNESISDWRRSNITRIVRMIHDKVKAVKPWIKLSSSPIGKYKNLSRYSAGGWNCYDGVWQDPQAWLRDGLQDMLFPMMYFKGDNFYPFLFDWKENSYGKPVCPGLGIYFLDPKEGKWTLNDVRAQIHTARKADIGGVVFYRSDFLTRNIKGLYDAVCDEFFTTHALTPCIDKNAPIPATPINMRMSKGEICWNDTNNVAGGILYNVYSSNTYPVDTEDPRNIIASRVSECHYPTSSGCLRYYAVTAMNRFGTESAAVQEANPVIERPDIHSLINRPVFKSLNKKKEKKGKKK